jgi:hypothetical protein
MHAAREVRRLGDGDDLGEIGLWADRIRSDPEYADTSPWHYMNIADGESLAEFEHPPEGDVLWAIARFSSRLGNESLGRDARSEALKFLTHFVVDLHQPLHVGLAEDRGGNEVMLRFRGERTNLHRFWDTHAVVQAGQSLRANTAEVTRLAAASVADAGTDPLQWAQESLDLRARVYDFGSAEPPQAYLDFAAQVTQERLVLASLRLAATLNGIFCD